jgi:hypothetical protein
MAATPARLMAPDDFSSGGFNDQTIRDIVWTSVGGQAVRISLSDQFGRQPVTFGQVDVGVSAGGPLIIPGAKLRTPCGSSAHPAFGPSSESKTGGWSRLLSQKASRPAMS